MLINSEHGHRIYPDDKINCVCIDFDYWGTFATLQVPYAKYRFVPTVSLCGLIMDTYLQKQPKMFPAYTAGRSVDKRSPIPQVSDRELQKRLAVFKHDGTGRDNTNALIKHNNYAAKFCRNLKVPGLPQGYFDLGNAYEMAIIWLESDNIDMVDPTAIGYPGMYFGMKNTNGRFYNLSCNTCWSSSEFNANCAWSISYDGFVETKSKSDACSIITSRVITENSLDVVRCQVDMIAEIDNKIRELEKEKKEIMGSIISYIDQFTKE